jgi:hypothetical protein
MKLVIHANKIVSQKTLLSLLKDHYVYIKTFSSHLLEDIQVDVMESDPFVEYAPLEDIELELYCYEPKESNGFLN